jgi:hypothetical protein
MLQPEDDPDPLIRRLAEEAFADPRPDIPARKVFAALRAPSTAPHADGVRSLHTMR